MKPLMATIDGNEPGTPNGGQKAPSQGITLTPEQIKRRRQRNLAIGLAVGFLVLLFYVVTIVKL
ncbi:MAG: hypothetical protein JO163_00465, partial [Methylobacteriaceae bacterium]|nr:hypothetical protein [Methylobacteriaceae bacterium]